MYRSDVSSLSSERVASIAAQRKSEYYHLLYSEINERQRAERRASQRNDLLNALSQAHLRFVAHQDLATILADLVRSLVDLTGSELCLIGEIRLDATEDEPLHILATSAQGMPDDATYHHLARMAYEAGLNQRAIARTTGPKDEPGPHHAANAAGFASFAGMPFRVEDAVFGVIALANRPGGYDDEVVELLQPAVSTCAHLLVAERNEQRRKKAEKELAEERASLAQRVFERTAQLSAANAELAHALRIKDEFLATMNHELRTPLNTMLILVEVLQQQIFGPLNQKQMKNVHDIGESGRHLLALITDILDIVKVNAGKLELDISTVMVQDLCESSMRLTAAMAGKKQIKVSMNVASNVKEIDADDRRLKQMLVNLLSNAVKFTPDGGEVGLDVKGEPETNTVVFTVWDTGIGIAAENMDRLFTPFAQIDSGLSRQYEGSGLGLALVARMADLCGGSVAVESEVGHGSRFMLSLPWRREDAAPISITMWAPQEMAQAVQKAPDPAEGPVSLVEANRPDEAAEFAHRSAGRDSLVLLAEDNEANVHALSDFLEHQGYTLIVAHTGREAMDLAKSARPDIILMDIQMPDMDGLEAIRNLRADRDLGKIPIIAVTALVLPGDRERCLSVGANDFVGKPISIRDLTNAINGLLQPEAATIAAC